MKRTIRFTLAASTILCLAPTAFTQTVNDDLKNCRGTNYNMAERHNPIDQWLNYDEAIVVDNLDKLEAFGVNALRVFSSFSVWRDGGQVRADYLADLQHLATQAFQHDMLLMLVFFDSFGLAPSGNNVLDAANGGWFISPEIAYLSNFEDNPEVVDFINDTMAAVALSESMTIGPKVIYDAWNEPSDNGAGSISDSILDFVLSEIKSTDANARTTVGFAPVERNERLITWMDSNGSNSSKLDILSYHPYGIFEQVITNYATKALEYSTEI